MIPYDWELTDSQVKSYFPDTGVDFDSNNVVKHVYLLFDERRLNVDDKANRAFNYIFRYFSQRYSGMRTRDMYEKQNNSCIYTVGKEYYWDTSLTTISIKYYKKYHDSEICSRLPKSFGACVAEGFCCGTYIEVE